MTPKELQRIFQKGECLSLDTLRIYNEGKLSKKSMHEVEKHLLECGLCAGAVDGLSQKRLSEVNKLAEHIQKRLAVYMNTPPRISFFKRFAYLIITGIIVLVGSCSWWFFIANKKSESATQSGLQLSYNNQNSNLKSVVPINPKESNSNQEKNISTSEKNPDKTSGTNIKSSSAVENLPAVLPGKENSLTVGQSSQVQTENNLQSKDESSSISGPTTKNANQFIRIKNIQVYPPVTLNDKSTRKEAKDGQLGRPSSSEASFELDQMPFFIGGDEALKNFIYTNFKPVSVDKTKISRFATGVMFVVNSKTGAVSSPDISFSISPEIDTELLRVINQMPNWNPGKKKGEVQIMLGVTFE